MWTDIDLSDRGREEVLQAGQILKEHGFTFDVAFTSVLKRAIRTLWILLDEMDLMWIPVHRNWRLNERHYGALQGLNKSETTKNTEKNRYRNGAEVTTYAHPLSNWKIRDIHAMILVTVIF